MEIKFDSGNHKKIRYTHNKQKKHKKNSEHVQKL